MLKVKPFRQKAGFCGPASLKIVLEFYGVKKSEKELAKLSNCQPRLGVSAPRLVEAAKKLGFKGFFKDFATLKDIKKYVLKKKIPVIVDWFAMDEGHYSVVVDVNQENIYLQDPGLGHLQAMRIGTFKRVWFDFPGSYIKSKNDIFIRRLIVIYKD